MHGWRGPRAARVDPPGERLGGQCVQMTLDTVPLATDGTCRTSRSKSSSPVKPDLAIELDLSLGDQRRKVDAMIEPGPLGPALPPNSTSSAAPSP